ncbi:MAG: hypothetical protein AAGH41_10550 [Pseudomonadota bacterium]
MPKESFDKITVQSVGLLCAAASLALGVVYLLAAGAPLRYVVINVAAFVVGLCAVIAARCFKRSVHRFSGLFTAVASAALLATAVFGVTVEGVTRWVAAGPVLIQPSLVLLPALVVGFVRRRDLVTTSAVLVAALSMGVQPDRAMAGAMFAALAALACFRRDKFVYVALAGAATAFIAALVQPDPLPAAERVERVLFTAFTLHPALGFGVVSGSALLVVPAFFGMLGPHREAYAVFGTTWGAIILAAVVGNYPTPVVGYSGAAVLGYVLSLAALPGAASVRAGTQSGPASGNPDNDDGSDVGVRLLGENLPA